MSKPGRTEWPSIDAAYTDEFGRIEPDVYRAASAIWGRCERFALETLGDGPAGLRLMMKAAAIATRRRGEPGTRVANLNAYLFQIYKRLVLAELQKEREHHRRAGEIYNETVSAHASPLEGADRRILVAQAMRHMDDWMREVFELLVLGHSFEEIGRLRNQNAHALRTKFSKRLRRLIKKIDPGRG